MQTIIRTVLAGLAILIIQPFLFLIKAGFNPYVIFTLLLIFLFLLYFLFFYKGNLKLLQKDFEKLPPKNKREVVIFIFGGIFIALILFYESLGIFYGLEDLNKYHSLFIDNLSTNIVNYLIMLLSNVGIVK